MNKNISDMMNDFSDMMKDNNFHTDDTSTNSKSTPTFDFSKISPELLSAFTNMLNNSKGDSKNSSSSNIDMDTIIKMKTIMEKMNDKNNPRSNLLLSLKPYLKESRKSKVDQYISLLNMGNIMDIFGNTGGGKK